MRKHLEVVYDSKPNFELGAIGFHEKEVSKGYSSQKKLPVKYGT